MGDNVSLRVSVPKSNWWPHCQMQENYDAMLSALAVLRTFLQKKECHKLTQHLLPPVPNQLYMFWGEKEVIFFELLLQSAKPNYLKMRYIASFRHDYVINKKTYSCNLNNKLCEQIESPKKPCGRVKAKNK